MRVCTAAWRMPNEARWGEGNAKYSEVYFGAKESQNVCGKIKQKSFLFGTKNKPETHV